MSLANPIGLVGLLALPVIVGLHLLRARRRRYTVSSLSLWSFLEEEVRGSAPRRVPPGWLLALDLLAAALLSLAWAQPQLPRPVLIQPARQLALVLDVSTSMNGQDARPSRFEQARAAALDELRGLRERDAAVVIAFGAHARVVGDTRQAGLDELVRRVGALKAGESGSNLSEALASAAALETAGQRLEIHVFTDGAYALNEQDTGLPAKWHRFGERGENQAVLDIATSRTAAGESEIFVRVVNFGKQSARRTARLLLDGQESGQVELELAPGAAVTHVWTVSGSAGAAVVKLDGEDDLPDDDQAATALPASRGVRAALVSDQPDPLARALRAVPGVRLTVLSPEEYQAGLDYDLTVFRGTLPAAWPQGTVLVFDPPEGSALLPVQGDVDGSGQSASMGTGLPEGVDFSGVTWGKIAHLQETPAGFTSAAQVGGAPLVLVGQSGGTRIEVLLARLEEGNLARHPALPVLLASAAQSAAADGWPAQAALGEAVAFPAGKYSQVRIVPPEGDAQEWGNEAPVEWRPGDGPGVYRVEMVTPSGEQRTTSLGVNAGSADESDLRPRGGAPDGEEMESAAEQVENRPLTLAPWLLGISLLVMLVETWLAWR